MEYGAIDLHTKRSQIRIVTADGAVVLERKIDTTRGALTEVWGGRAAMRILVESSTESEWVAQHVEGLGHEVVVADPNFAAMYASRSRKVKTDTRDVAALAEANRTGVFRRAHRVSVAAQQLRQTMRVRAHLVRLRSQTISLVRAVVRREGVRVPGGAAESLLTRLESLALPAAVDAILAPLRAVLRQLNAEITAQDEAVEVRATADATTQRLMTAPGVGPVVALTFQAVIDDPARFGGDARRVSAFLGLVPAEDSSGERQHKGHITKAGPPDVRALLVQASWSIWRGRSVAGAALRRWAHALADRRGRRIAIVALARRLSRILLALWRDQRDFVAPPVRDGAAA
jgi:transposase